MSRNKVRHFKTQEPSLIQSIAFFDVFILFLICAVTASGVGVVYTKHASRKYFSQLQAQEKLQDQLHIEWSQLLLEQGALGAQARVEKIAKDKLTMENPKRHEFLILDNKEEG